MESEQKEKLKEKISEIMRNAANSQINVKGNYVNLRKLEELIYESIDEI